MSMYWYLVLSCWGLTMSMYWYLVLPLCRYWYFPLYQVVCYSMYRWMIHRWVVAVLPLFCSLLWLPHSVSSIAGRWWQHG